MSDYLLSRAVELSDDELANVKFAALTPTARAILSKSKFPYADVLLNGTPEEIRVLNLRLAKQFFGEPPSITEMLLTPNDLHDSSLVH